MFDGQKLLTFSEAARELPSINGRRIHANSVWRWARKGINGVKLEAWRVGRQFVTTEVALKRFFAELAKAEHLSPSTSPRPHRHRPRLPQERARAIAAAEAKLQGMGF